MPTAAGQLPLQRGLPALRPEAIPILQGKLATPGRQAMAAPTLGLVAALGKLPSEQTAMHLAAVGLANQRFSAATEAAGR